MIAGQPVKRGCIGWLVDAVESIFLTSAEPVSRSIYHRGEKYVIMGSDWAEGQRIIRIADDRLEAMCDQETPVRLVTFRQDFRRIANRPRVAGLIPCLEDRNAETVRLAIWLLGRKHVKFAIRFIAPFAQSGNARVRREAARALRRLEAWSELRAMAAIDPDERVCRLATPEPPKPFGERFERFAGDAQHEATATHRRSMAFFARTPIGPGKIPKTPDFIRALLERIHRLVHG